MCPKGVRKEEVQRESLCEMGELGLAATSSASLAASAVSYRQIQASKWPLVSHCLLVQAFSKFEILGSSSTLSRILLFMFPWEWTSKGNKALCLAFITQTEQFFREEFFSQKNSMYWITRERSVYWITRQLLKSRRWKKVKRFSDFLLKGVEIN